MTATRKRNAIKTKHHKINSYCFDKIKAYFSLSYFLIPDVDLNTIYLSCLDYFFHYIRPIQEFLLGFI